MCGGMGVTTGYTFAFAQLAAQRTAERGHCTALHWRNSTVLYCSTSKGGWGHGTWREEARKCRIVTRRLHRSSSRYRAA